MLSGRATIMRMGMVLFDRMLILTAMNDGSTAVLKAWLGTGREREVADGGVTTLMGCGVGCGLWKACCCGAGDSC